jgi:hypothetical protein
MRILRDRCRPFALTALILAVAFSPPRSQLAWATGAHDVDWRHLVERAQLVVLGRVERTGTRWQNGRIVTDAVVRVEQGIKGGPNETIHIMQPGGRVGNLAMRVIGAAEFRPGDRAIFFLVAVRDAYHVVGMANGKLDLAQDADGVEWVRWGRAPRRMLSAALADIRSMLERR